MLKGEPFCRTPGHYVLPIFNLLTDRLAVDEVLTVVII